MPIDIASETGSTDGSPVVWRLTIGKVDVLLRWVIVDRRLLRC
jgi:hypothetical protein